MYVVTGLAAALGVTVLVSGIWIKTLQGSVSSLREENATLTAQVKDLTVDADALKEKDDMARREIARLSEQKTKETVRIVRERIPSDCDGALQWLVQELK